MNPSLYHTYRFLELNDTFPFEGQVFITCYPRSNKVEFSGIVNPLGPLGRANMRAIRDLSPEIENAYGVHEEFDPQMPLSHDSFFSLRRAIESLADYPSLNDTYLAQEEERDREDAWDGWLKSEVSFVIGNCAFYLDLDPPEIETLSAFRDWARALGVDVSERESWGINGDYDLDTRWIGDAAIRYVLSVF